MTALDFTRDEAGSGGTWSIFAFLVSAIVAGISIDGTNAMRAREELQATADIAAHAGLVELIADGEHAEIRAAVSRSIETNMPRAIFGDPTGGTTSAIEIGTYEDGRMVTGQRDNAVVVTLQRSSALDNAVPTFLLKLIGRTHWNVLVTSAAVMDSPRTCSANDGIYASGEVKMTSHAEIGAGFCIYGKETVELSNHNIFQPGARIGATDLENCNQCTDAHNPGIEDAAFEGNLQLQDVSEHIQDVMGSLLGTSEDYEPMETFLEATAMGYDLSPLADLDYQTSRIRQGSIISISGSDFEEMDFVPAGLVYAVYCSSPLPAVGALTPKSDGDGNGKKSDSSKGNIKTLSLETGTGARITDVAIMTDCQLDFGKTAEIVNSIVATTSGSKQSISASASARIGSALMSCPSTEKVVVMTLGDMSVPAAMETNNVDFYIAGDAHIASGTSVQASRLGTSFFVDGDIHISAQGTWDACGDAPDSLAAEIGVIRQVIPTGG